MSSKYIYLRIDAGVLLVVTNSPTQGLPEETYILSQLISVMKEKLKYLVTLYVTAF